jgi:hypothetical protein
MDKSCWRNAALLLLLRPRVPALGMGVHLASSRLKRLPSASTVPPQGLMDLNQILLGQPWRRRAKKILANYRAGGINTVGLASGSISG